MKLKKIIFTIFAILLTSKAVAAEGVIDVKSNYNVNQTADRLEKILNKKGIIVFNRIKHSDGAAKVGISLRDTQLIIFGNPKIGSVLMKCAQSTGLDLPMKALIWQDKNKNVWISYNDPKFLETRHDIKGCDKVLNKVATVLDTLSNAAAK